MILSDQGFDDSHRLLHAVLRCRRKNHRRIQHLSGRIHYRDLTAGAEGRIPAQYGLSTQRGLHQQLPQVFTEDLNRSILCPIRQFIPNLRLDRRPDQPLIGIGTGLANIGRTRWMLFCAHLLRHKVKNLRLRHLQPDAEDLLLFTTIQCQHTVTWNLTNRL